MARVNTPKTYQSYVKLIGANDLRTKKKRMIDLCSPKGYKTIAIRCPSLSNREFFVHVRKPNVKNKVRSYCWFSWNNVNFYFSIFTLDNELTLQVDVDGVYKRRIDISKIKKTTYKKFETPEQKLARYFMRVCILARKIAQTMIEDYGKNNLQNCHRQRTTEPKEVKRVNSFRGLNNLVKNRKFAWREEDRKNLEIRRAKRRRYRNAMIASNKPECVKRTMQAFRSILADPNNVISKFFKEHPDLNLNERDNDEFGVEFKGDIV